MSLQRGDIVWADFGEPRGSEPAFIRPALIVQSDRYNRSNLATVLAVVITSNTRLARYPDNVFIPAGLAGLSKDSVVSVTQIGTIDQKYIREKTGTLPAHLMDQVDAGLRRVLGL
ncbi:MAG: type II toxin-antitoxin system PemK/MazF family toxin [Cellulomonadaceae bacterium]|nr:type II toxin-antitoxin system PemK/MazF family toxin [Cellulomonadaceae bacterium]